ncbi:MAG TPA: hypothetical protein VEW03_10725 [Longimicrobiaceae bacterium]|nr:hypothetical protein [Longimicrobiaceae bacterium]
MTRRHALLALLLGTLAIAAAYASAFLPGDPPGWSAWAMGTGTAVVMVSAMALGAVRRGGVGRLKLPFAFVFVVLAGGFAAVMLMPPEAPGDPLFLGLPARAAIVLIGIGLLPLLVLPVAYALTFDEMTLSDDDLARVRAAARELTAAPAPGEQATTAAAPAEAV